jgi:hypothetical protein
VPGERQLETRREDPHPCVASGLGREEEDRLGDVQLAGDALHLLAGERLPVGKNAELVPLERGVGEDVEDVVGVEIADGLELDLHRAAPSL